MHQSSLHIEITDHDIVIHALTDDANDGAAYVLTAEQATELAEKLAVSVQVLLRNATGRYSN